MSLALDRVTITLGGRPLVRGVSLELNPGEVVGLLGPNGAGKTTTFNLITGLLRPDEGNVRFDGPRSYPSSSFTNSPQTAIDAAWRPGHSLPGPSYLACPPQACRCSRRWHGEH